MPKKKRARDKTAGLSDDLLKELIEEYGGPTAIFDEGGLMGVLQKRLIETAMGAEMDNHLGYSKHSPEGIGTGNSRNGSGRKTILLANDQIEIETPRDRNGSFEPQLIGKREKRFEGFDEQIISLYARGMSVRDIRSWLHETYQVEVSDGLISTVTDAVIEDVRAWQSRPLDPIYPIVFLDCLVVKSREDGRVRNKSVYLSLGVNMYGHKELLGLWIANTEGAKFWLGVITELKNRGLEDVFVACVDGLKGFPEAIEAVFPETEVQLCIVHMIRNCVRYVSWKDRKELCADMKKIYAADTIEHAEMALEELAKKWDKQYPTVSQLWRTHWERLTPYFDFPKDIRKVIYTTNAIESINRSMRKILKTKGAFPHDEAILKIMYLALQNISKKWTMPIRNWPAALNQFAIKYEERFPL
jgi:putative transposase